MSTAQHTPGQWKPIRLTEPQKRLLRAACRNGGVTRGASARKPADALQKAGLAVVEVEVQPDAMRGRHKLRYLVMATAQGRIVAFGANALINQPYATSAVKRAVDATYDQDYMDDEGRRAAIAKATGSAS